MIVCDHNERWRLIAITTEKISHEYSQADVNLRRMVLLCGTLDSNLPTSYFIDSSVAVNENLQAL